jgi:hypothetical protein
MVGCKNIIFLRVSRLQQITETCVKPKLFSGHSWEVTNLSVLISSVDGMVILFNGTGELNTKQKVDIHSCLERV